VHIEALLLDLFYSVQGKFIKISKVANHQVGGCRMNGNKGGEPTAPPRLRPAVAGLRGGGRMIRISGMFGQSAQNYENPILGILFILSKGSAALSFFAPSTVKTDCV
jgi:hypothetical protein